MTEVPSGAVGQEIERARGALRSAEILAAAGEYPDAVSRAYYAIFHAACALLASIGRTARTHDGVRRLVSEHFVRPGLLDPRFARALAHTGADRSEADYDVSAVFGEADVQQNIGLAREFIGVAEAITSQGPA